MIEIGVATKVLWVLGSLLTFALALRLWLIRLAVTYKAFFAYLVITVLRDMFFWTLDIRRSSYALFYMATQALIGLLLLLVILEIFSLVLQEYPAIRTFSRWFLWGVVLISSAGAGLLLYADITVQRRPGPLELFFSVERGGYAALVLCILAVSAFLMWYPIRLPRNVVVHSTVFVAYFLLKAAVLLFRSALDRAYWNTIDVVLMVLSSCIVVLWISLLKPTGERVNVVVGHQWNGAEQQRLLEQLQGINTVLARVGHR